MGEHVERFVPVGKASLVDDAPGWSGGSESGSKNTTAEEGAAKGPICWKCRGSGVSNKKRKRDKKEESETPPKKTTCNCAVCQGTGHLPAKKEEALALQSRPGEITRIRRCPVGWTARGPLPSALQANSQTPNQREAVRLVKLAETSKEEVSVNLENPGCQFDKSQPLPLWLPQRGEQLCNLVGSWRILQRVASHRWTTDDLVTSYMAGLVLGEKTTSKDLRYLDLGCGNGSVLLMTTWQLCTRMLNDTNDGSNTTVTCTGIEARSEAVQLSRRSIDYNLGPQSTAVDIQVHHGDFRSILDTLITGSTDQQYDLVTGTPPYFRVDFTVEKDSNVAKAVIQQGGMPTCKQSAPARCEFRGGIEAYCQAATRAMHKESLFCVCENWLNNDRVDQGAKDANLVVVEVLPVKGRTGKPCPLFAVYVMRKQEFFEGTEVPQTKVLDSLAVRDDDGDWTEEYQKVLEAMSISVAP